MNKFTKVILLLLFSMQISVADGQSTGINSLETELDESILYGKLNNGLSYFIKHLPESQEKTNLRFYIKAGSNNEESDQLNMAHFVEHMAFKSSENFPKGIFNDAEILQRMNMSVYDINGTAGNFSTKYIFNAPKHNEIAIETGLLWFRDIAGGALHFKEEEIDTERGVLIQELIKRSGDNVQKSITRSLIRSELFPCRLGYSNYIKHHETFPSGRLKQFYKDWYRPDLMAIVIVGNIENVAALEKQIISQFSDINPIDNPRESTDCDALFFSLAPQFTIMEDKGASLLTPQAVKTELYFRDPDTRRKISDLEEAKNMKLLSLFIDIANKRFAEASEVYNSSYDSHINHTIKGKNLPSSFFLNIHSEKQNEQKAIQASFRILRQFQKYGALESEFKAAIDKQLDVASITPSQSRYWVEEIEKFYVHDEILPGNKFYALRNWLSGYSLKEFNDFIKKYDFEMPDDIGILVPTGHEALSFSEPQVRNWISSVEKESIPAYSPPIVPETLMTTSEVDKLHENSFKDNGIGESGARELVLENGVKVVLKSFKPSSGVDSENLLLHGFINKGAYNYSEEDYFSAVNAPRFIKNSGVGKFDKFELQRFLANTSLPLPFLKLYIENLESGIKISAKLEDLEKMLQLVYLYSSAPRVDTLAFQDWKTQQTEFYQNQHNSKLVDLNYNIKKILGDVSEVSSGTERYHGIEETEMNRGFEIYKDLFGNAQDFTFMLTGDFPVNSVIALINKYLGNLPSTKDQTKTKVIVNTYDPKPPGPALFQFKALSYKEQVNFIYKPLHIVPVEGHLDWKDKIRTQALGRVLYSRVLELRFDKGYSLYSVHAYSVYNEANKHFEFGAQFNCTPEEYPLLRTEYSNIIDELKSELISDDLLKQSLSRMLFLYNPKGRGNTNRVVQEKLYNHYRYKTPWTDKHEILPFIESLTPEDIRKTAKKYLKEEYSYDFLITN